MQKKTDAINELSLASEILKDYKRNNQILKALLLVSILVNLLIVILWDYIKNIIFFYGV